MADQEIGHYAGKEIGQRRIRSAARTADRSTPHRCSGRTPVRPAAVPEARWPIRRSATTPGRKWVGVEDGALPVRPIQLRAIGVDSMEAVTAWSDNALVVHNPKTGAANGLSELYCPGRRRE